MLNRLLVLIFLSIPFSLSSACAQEQSLSVSTANNLIKSFSDSSAFASNTSIGRQPGYILEAMDRVWEKTADGVYFRFIQKNVDAFLDHSGDFRNLNKGTSLIESYQYGSSLLTLYKVTGKIRYFDAATRIWGQMQDHGKFVAGDCGTAIPFYAEYAALINDNAAFNSITEHFLLEDREILNGSKPLSSEDRIGRLGLALVDVLDYIPESHNKKILLQILKRCTNEMQRIAMRIPGSWSAMEPLKKYRYLYTITKGARLNYIGEKADQLIGKGYANLVEENGPLAAGRSSKDLNSERQGLLLLALTEAENYELPKPAINGDVLLDSYFNNETKTDQSGNLLRWHYKWEERGDNGFSMWAGQFRRAGYETATLYSRPRRSALRKSAVYIIVDPDTKKENKDPAFIGPDDVKEISAWVRSGGVLLLMANDSANTELDHLNRLAGAFGVKFNKDSKGKVTGDQFDMGRITIGAGNSVFRTAREVFIKEFSSLELRDSARAILKDRDGNTVVATTRFGKGMVLFIGDPWLYNEYVDGRKLPAEYDNFQAGADLVDWITKQLGRVIKNKAY